MLRLPRSCLAVLVALFGPAALAADFYVATTGDDANPGTRSRPWASLEAAREAGIWVGVCGETAGEPTMIPKLIELGVTELSMSAPSIPRAKKVVSEL